MKFMMLLKSDHNAEAGVMPDAELIAAMGRYNEELLRAGVLLSGEGLQASAKGARVRLADGRFSVANGPFAEPRDLIAGFWLIQVKSKEEAIEWAKQVPFDPDGPSATSDGAGEIELRQVYEPSDFSRRGSEAGRREIEMAFHAPPVAPSIDARPRFAAFLKADAGTEAGLVPDANRLAAMSGLMEETSKAGALLAGEGLHPSARGARIRFLRGRRTVLEGPFAATPDLIAGYSIVRAASRAEAVEWAKRCLAIHVASTRVAEGEVEVRQIFDESDFPAELVAEVAEVFAAERELRARHGQ